MVNSLDNRALKKILLSLRSLSPAAHPRGGRQGRAQGRDPVAGGTDHEARVQARAHLLRGNAHQRSVGHDGRALVDEGPLDAVGDENPLKQLPVPHLLVWKLHFDPLSVVATVN